MKTVVTCFVSSAAILVLCLAAQSADQTKWSQPVDTTYPVGQRSETCHHLYPTPGIWDDRSADDWMCLDGAPITKIAWWGDYHMYLPDQAGTVDPPTVLPTSFIMRQYSNDATDPTNTKPGDLITEVEIPMAKCNQTFVQTVSSETFGQVHIFGYEVTLDTSWTQTKDSIYWLQIQAKFDNDPAEILPEPPYMGWDWLNTSPEDFLGAGVVSYDGGTTWDKAAYYGGPYDGKPFNFAFELLPATFSPFNLKLGNAVLPTSGTLVLSADITVKGTSYAGVQCLPYVAVTAGGVQNFVLSGNKVTTKMTPYLTNGKARYFTLSEDILNLPIASIAYTGLAKGQYPVQAALLNSRGAVMGQIAERTLTIE